MLTLVLNAGYEPLHLVSWQKALCLVFTSKAEVVAEYDAMVRSVSQAFKLPSVVRLKRYVRSVRRVVSARCTRKNVLLRDKFQCQYCGVYCTAAVVTIDHVIPKSKGGFTTWENVVAACPPCNRKKGDKRLSEAGMILLRPARRPSWFELVSEPQKNLIETWLPFIGKAG